MDVDGICNVRDFGGYKVAGGKKVNFDLIFRGTAMDEDPKDSGFATTITDAGKKTMLNEMKIKTDVDLREKDSKKSPLGSSVNYKNFTIGNYTTFINSNKGYIKDIFTMLADKNNYPLYFHCQGGADRTGSLCALILSFLGVSEEEVKTDFEFTTLSAVGPRSRNEEGKFVAYWEALTKTSGSTLQEKATNYLKSCGISDDTLNKVKSIMLG